MTKNARTFLRPEFPNGVFGDPALAIWEENGNDGLLVDCGDLSRFTFKKLLRVSAIFLSHCHMDHFFGFDTFLRAHIGSKKTVSIFGPPETSARVSGKLQGYTWNLIDNDLTQFRAIDLNPATREKTTTHFHAQNRFLPSNVKVENWDPSEAVYNTDLYFVKTALLDHRTPSLAYAIEEHPSFAVNAERVLELGLKTGSWISQLKAENTPNVNVPLTNGTFKTYEVSPLRSEIFIPRIPLKIIYVTDGAANSSNYDALLKLIRNADVMFSETCFLPEDQNLADQTKHFTSEFIGKLAQEAGVKKLAPFHFSKRYQDRPDQVLASISKHFHGELLTLRATLSACRPNVRKADI